MDIQASQETGDNLAYLVIQVPLALQGKMGMLETEDLQGKQASLVLLDQLDAQEKLDLLDRVVDQEQLDLLGLLDPEGQLDQLVRKVIKEIKEFLAFLARPVIVAPVVKLVSQGNQAPLDLLDPLVQLA
jgi:hypothetical protein